MNFLTVKKISSREGWKIRLILIGFLAFGLLTVRFYPLNYLREYFPDLFRYDSSCLMLNIFGIPCPFCGMSHALSEFFRFNFSGSIYYNPSSVIFFTFLGVCCLGIFVLSLFNYKIIISFNKKTLIAFVLVLIIIWILNIMFGHYG